MVAVGILGSGFIADSYAEALLDVRDATLVGNWSRSPERARSFAERWSSPWHGDDMDELCRRSDLVVVALPNEAHLSAVELVASHRKGVVCTKPLARTGDEAMAMLRAVRAAGVWHGYAESSVFSPNVAKAHDMIARGGIGDLLTMRAREAHSGPHSAHFWNAQTAGGGALLDMGCHTVESARHFFGKDNAVLRVMAWGSTMVHTDKTTGEDFAVALVEFAGGQLAIIESAWIERGGMQLRHELVGTRGRVVTDSSATPVWGFVTEPVGYLVEKSDAETGWVYPVPEETRAYGFSQQMRHFVETFARGETPRETFEDGVVVNCVIDAAYASMRSGTWQGVQLPDGF